MSWLVTGANGFVGRHVVGVLRARGDLVVAAGHEAEVELEMRHSEDVHALIERVAPSFVVHLAGTSSLGAMARDPTGGQDNVLLPAIHLFDAVKKHAPAARILLVSTCHVYGNAPLPTDESAPLRPLDLYGSARASVEWMAARYVRDGVRIITARAFHHTGPGQKPPFALPDWAAQAAAGVREIRVGNLDVRRDYCDVRDVAGGYVLLAERGEGVYNLASGVAYTARELFEMVAPGCTPVVVEDRKRRAEVPEFRGDARRAEALGWTRRFAIEDTLRELRAEA